VRFGETDAANGWDELCRQAPGNTRDAFELMRSGLIRRVSRGPLRESCRA